MRRILIIASSAVLLAAPVSAFADEGGAAAGAATGAIGGAIVGGPVGAAVGGAIGGAAGSAATDNDNDHAQHRRIESTGSIGCRSTTVHKQNSAGASATVHKRTCD